MNLFSTQNLEWNHMTHIIIPCLKVYWRSSHIIWTLWANFTPTVNTWSIGSMPVMWKTFIVDKVLSVIRWPCNVQLKTGKRCAIVGMFYHPQVWEMWCCRNTRVGLLTHWALQMGSCNSKNKNINISLLPVTVFNCQYGIRESSLPFALFKFVNTVGMRNWIFKDIVDSSGYYVPLFTHSKQIVSACTVQYTN